MLSPAPDLSFRLPDFDDALASLPADASSPGFWPAVHALYDVSREPVNLENGYWGAMATPVMAMLQHWTQRVNHENSLLVRRHWPALEEGLRDEVAQALGCAAHEIALTRGATEAALALIGGFNRLSPGDTVLYCDLDYPATRHAMAWLRQRRGVEPVKIDIPEPAGREAVLRAYADALARHPRTKLVLLTHLVHCTGLVMPVRELTTLARDAGAMSLVDAAHSWGQLDFGVRDLGADFAVFNLHKWIGAPLGCGALYVREGGVEAIDPHCGDTTWPAGDVRGCIHTGSPNFAAWLTIPAALQLHRRIGVAAKAQRLRALRDRWVSVARTLPGLDVLTPDEPGMSGGITAFRLRGRTSAADNDAIVDTLLSRHGLFTVRRDGPTAGCCVRVTPAVSTREDEVDRLVRALPRLVD